MRPRGTPEQLFERRLRAVRLVLDEGLTRTEAGRYVGAHRNSVTQWVKLYEADGEDGLRVESPPGRPPGLTDAQRDDIVRCILEGAPAHGFETDLWTLPRIARLIERRHGVRYDVDHLSRLVRAWGLSWQQPAKRPIERDDDKIAHWIARDWPRIKKKRVAATPTSCSSTSPATC